jgi:hypothetical protein
MILLDVLKKNVSQNIKYVFILDGETDSLYGEIFSIGAVVADIETGEIVDKFVMTDSAYMTIITNEFVNEHVIPPIKLDLDMNYTFKQEELFESFWKFYLKYKDNSIFIADFGTPVEAYVFRRCITMDIPTREFQGPYPLHELGTILFMSNLDPDMCRDSYFTDIKFKHNPYYDCVSTLNVLKNSF